jgi:hypothetical protein
MRLCWCCGVALSEADRRGIVISMKTEGQDPPNRERETR